MVQDSKYLSEVFNNKYDSLFQVEKKKTIEVSLYALGVLLRSTHLKEKNIRPYNPKDNELIDKWDLEIWMRVTWGTNDVKKDDAYEREFDIALTNGIPYFDYLISNAVKYERPAWSIFGLIGMMQGTLNQNKYTVFNKEDILTKEDFVRCLKYLPAQFLNRYKGDLTYLFSYFDEWDYKLTIDGSENVSIENLDSLL